MRIPKCVAQKAGLTQGMPVDFQARGGTTIIRPKRYSLEMLLSQITPENLHGEVGSGRPVGQEVR